MCTVSLRTDLLTGSPAGGGTWVYNGFIPVDDDMNGSQPCPSWPPTFPATNTPGYNGNPNDTAQFTAVPQSGSPSVFPPEIDTDPDDGTHDPGMTVEGGEDPTLNFTGADPGFYSFTYTVTAGSCSSSANVVLPVYPSPQMGTNAEVIACTNDDTLYDIWNYWENTALQQADPPGPDAVAPNICIAENVEFTGSGINTGVNNYFANGIGAADDQFTPDGLTPGQYEFTLTFTTPIDGAYQPLSGCTNCEATATITFDVQSAPDPGVGGNNAVCN